MSRHPASRKGAGGGRGGAQYRSGRPADSHAPVTPVEASPDTEAETAPAAVEAALEEPTAAVDAADDAQPADAADAGETVDAAEAAEADDAGETDIEAEAEPEPELVAEAPAPVAEPVSAPVAPVVEAPPAAHGTEAADAPGLEPLIGLVQAALGEIDAALQQGSDARTALLALASGAPGDDRDVIGFLRRSLAPSQAQLLAVLAGLSEERRALEAASADLDRIYTRTAYSAADGLARVSEATADIRSTPVPVVAEQVARPAKTAGHAGPQAGAATLVAAVAAVPATPAAADHRDDHDDHRSGGPGGTPSGEGDHDHAGSHAAGGTSAVARLAGALRRSAGQALGVYQVGDAADHEAESDEAAAGAPGGQPTGVARSVAAHSPVRLVRPARRAAKYAALVGVPALVFSGLGGMPPRVDAVPAPATPIAQTAATPTGSLAPEPTATSIPGVTTASDIPIGDDAAPVIGTASQPGNGMDPGTVDQNGAEPTGLPSQAPNAVVGGAVITYHGPTNRRVVALTFDDGYNTAALKKVLATLIANKVKATFFVNGIYLSRSPQTWKQVAQAGFPVGNHTYHHVDIRHLSAAQLAKELEMTESAWRKATGTDLIPYFRPPYGTHNSRADARVAADGYPNIVLWSSSVADTSSATTIATGTAAALRAGPGGIVLMHVGPTLTPELLQGVIDGFRARGFDFVTIPELLGN